MRPTRTASAKIPRQIAHPVGREPKGSNSPHMRESSLSARRSKVDFTYVIDRTVQFREGLVLDRRVSDRVRIPVDLLAMQMSAHADAHGRAESLRRNP